MPCGDILYQDHGYLLRGVSVDTPLKSTRTGAHQPNLGTRNWVVSQRFVFGPMALPLRSINLPDPSMNTDLSLS